MIMETELNSGQATIWQRLHDYSIIGLVVASGLTVMWFGVNFIFERQARVTDSTDVGSAVEASSIAKGTLVRSTKGSYQVQGAFQLTFGNELVLEKRANLETYLCDKKLNFAKF
jgi:hypothetical protein